MTKFFFKSNRELKPETGRTLNATHFLFSERQQRGRRGVPLDDGDGSARQQQRRPAAAQRVADGRRNARLNTA